MIEILDLRMNFKNWVDFGPGRQQATGPAGPVKWEPELLTVEHSTVELSTVELSTVEFSTESWNIRQ